MAQPMTVEHRVQAIPPPGAVLSYAAEQTVRAIEELWPAATVRLGDVAPSVTSYVQQVDVDGRRLFAKLSIQGVSLVSVLRGTCGDWETVKAAQAAYRSSPGALLRREMVQLKALSTAGLRVPRVAGYASGVLFTREVSGPTLADVLASEPYRTTELLAQAVDELAPPLQHAGVVDRVDQAPIGERSISGTFLRKFNGLSGSTYLQQTGHSDVLTGVVSRLRKAKAHPAPSNLPVIFGDLKPEHVVFAEHGQLVFLDPGLQRGQPGADAAKLISRTLLNLVCTPPSQDDTRTMLAGIADFVAQMIDRLAEENRDEWLRNLVLMWLMDTTNILTTCLCAPPGLPLPAQASAVVARASTVVDMLDHASGTMTSRWPARMWWRASLDDVLWAVAQ